MANDLVIIGGGAAGLMAAVAAGEAGLSCMVLERRHRPGLKLLMCGNNRCNISHAADAAEMCRFYGGKTGEFLRPALEAFPPQALRAWFAKRGLPTLVRGERIYPRTENADDVLHCFMDRLRELGVPLALNSPVKAISREDKGGFHLLLENGFLLESRCVLLCTGGVSYPKTGSVGDGQRMAEELGLQVTPLRPGLAGVDHRVRWLTTKENSDIPDVAVTAVLDGKVVAKTRGNVLCAGSVLRGSAVFDAVRLLSHQGISQGMELFFDLCPDCSPENLSHRLAAEGATSSMLASLGIPEANAVLLSEAIQRNRVQNVAELLKATPVPVLGIRPLKEAIVTVGGVGLSQVDPDTMQCRGIPGLYVAGELLDVDGPTGGFNLHAAFATAQCAVRSVASRQKGGGRPIRRGEPSGHGNDGSRRSRF